MKWSDISNAPKDGSHILTYDPYDGWNQDCWIEEHEDWLGRLHSAHWQSSTEPTHWMPIPNPPSEEV